jgi:hypothetical protein
MSAMQAHLKRCPSSTYPSTSCLKRTKRSSDRPSIIKANWGMVTLDRLMGRGICCSLVAPPPCATAASPASAAPAPAAEFAALTARSRLSMMPFPKRCSSAWVCEDDLVERCVEHKC